MNELIFGRNSQQNIVSVEIHDNSIDLFVQDEQGNISVITEPNKLWLLCNVRIDETWKRLKGNLHYKYGKQFSSIKEYYDTKYSLKQYDIYTISDLKEQSLVNKGLTYYKGLSPKDISILSFDIETTGVDHNKDSKLLIISNTFRDSKGNVTRKLFAYDEFEDEGEMLKSWVAWIHKIDPSILLGHNIFNFDLLYIKFIADRYDVSLDLGRDGSALKFATRSSQYRVDGSRDLEYFNIKCYGREVLDSYMLALKYDVVTKKYESYGLKKIIAQEGLEDKDRQHYDAGQIRFKYKDPIEWSKIKLYAEKDSDDALKLWDLMCAPFFYSSQMIPKSFQRVMLSAPGSQINSMLVRSYLQEGHSIPKASYIGHIQGGLSFAIPGRYSNVLKIDIKSEYPSAIREYKIYDKEKDPNANLLNLVDFLTEKRFEYKELGKTDSYYRDMDSTMKVLINSIYGMLNTQGLNFNSPKCAEKVTYWGRELIKFSIEWATGEEYEIWKNKNNLQDL